MSIDYLSDLIGRMGQWAYLLIFVGAALESAAMIGLVVPGEALVLVAGFFAAQGLFDLDALIAVVALGAAVGDSMGYELGRRFGSPALHKYGARVGLNAERIGRVETFFDRWGAASVFLGRFVGFARALVPFLAGTSRMPYRVFLPYNIAGALAWAPAIVLLGYFLGQSWHLVEAWIGRISAILAGVALLGWLVRRHLRWPPRPWMEIAILVLCVCLFAAIAEDVATADPLTVVDLQLAHWLERHRIAALTPVLLVITHLHATEPIAVATLLMGLWLFRRRDWRWLATLALVVPGGMLLNVAVKYLFHRARPVVDVPILTVPSFSFPSGHVAGATLFYGMLCALVITHSHSTRARFAVIAGSSLAVILVAFSRMYLGVHYFSDVLGAFAEAAAWLTLCLAVTHGHLGRAWTQGLGRTSGAVSRQQGNQQ